MPPWSERDDRTGRRAEQAAREDLPQLAAADDRAEHRTGDRAGDGAARRRLLVGPVLVPSARRLTRRSVERIVAAVEVAVEVEPNNGRSPGIVELCSPVTCPNTIAPVGTAVAPFCAITGRLRSR